MWGIQERDGVTVLRPTIGALIEQLIAVPLVFGFCYAIKDLTYAITYTAAWGVMTLGVGLVDRVKLSPGLMTSSGRFRQRRTLFARDISDLHVGQSPRSRVLRLLGTTAYGERMAIRLPMASWFWGRGRHAQAEAILAWWETYRDAEATPLVRVPTTQTSLLTFPEDIDQDRSVRPAYVGPRGFHDDDWSGR